MKGDFSKWTLKPDRNYNDVLHQQGKVLLDSDWNDRVQLTDQWHLTAGQDIIGSQVAAVPAAEPDGFKVEQADASTGEVQLQVDPGHCWLDGRLVYLDGDGPQTRSADYLDSSSGDASSIVAGVTRDAVVLEVWQEAINGFQLPDQLIEPALGGPDTTERLTTAAAFKLFRLNDGDFCWNLADKLKDDTSGLGKLEVTLTPSATSGDECPVVMAEGYTGFEHNLYRFEIAHLDSPASGMRFKWSSLNGGLVGRGDYDATDPLSKTITITANMTAITSLLRKQFYLEIVEYNETAGHWEVIYGVNAVVNGNVLELGQEFYTLRAPSETNVFFRLWDGLELIEDYKKPSGTTLEKELQDGIRLGFDSESSSTYRPGDYWQFTVRAGQKASADPLLEDQIPQGPVRRRAPLAIIHWNASLGASDEAGEIDDCRRVFKPLTNQRICCTYTIGDGEQSQGDFNDFNEALRQLPDDGGQLCLLPGVHRIHAKINQRHKLRITGCGRHTVVTCLPDKEGVPNFDLVDCQNVEIDHLTIISLSATAVRLSDSGKGEQPLERIKIRENHIVGLDHALEIEGGRKIEISDNFLAVPDLKAAGPVVFILAGDSCVVENTITVVPPPEQPAPTDNGTPSTPGGFINECTDPNELYTANMVVLGFVDYIYGLTMVINMAHQYSAAGGIQVGSTSKQIYIRRNCIIGGAGHGISLGHLPSAQGMGHNPAYLDTMDEETLKMFRQKLNSFVYELFITDNRIEQMGLSGISTVTFFNLEKLGLLMGVMSMEVAANHITQCCRQLPQADPAIGAGTANVATDMAFGGIILSDGENISIKDNVIEKNGLSHLQAVCGIWMGNAEKIEICDNRIVDNAPRSSLVDAGAAKGWRGGVVIRLSLAKIMDDLAGLFTGDQPIMFQDSVPAAKIHDNVVVQPLGQALVLMAMGPVSVANNHFTSQGTVNVLSALQKFDYDAVALMGATVIILNLGIAKDIFPLLLLQSFAQLGHMTVTNKQQDLYTKEDVNAGNTPDVSGTSMTEAVDYSGFNLASLFYLPSGQILFDDNRTTLDLRGPAVSVLLSSQTLISLDDISFGNNQSEIASVLKFSAKGAIAEMDIAGNNTMLAAFSVRATNNRFQDGLTQGIPQKGYSLFSMAMMNSTMGNQATNCLLALGPKKYNLKFGNAVIFDSRCRDLTLRLLQRYKLMQIKS